MSVIASAHHNIVKAKGIDVISQAALGNVIEPDFSQASELTVVSMGTQNSIQQHCLYILLEHFPHCLSVLDHAGLRKYVTPPPVQAMIKQA